nr:MAG TPA: hypothetical protein [Caudoviricetes sp.]
MYVSNKEKLFQAVSNLDLVKMTNCLGSEYFWDQLPKLLECGYDQDFYNNWDEHGLEETLNSLSDGLDNQTKNLLNVIGAYIAEVGY